MLAEGCHSPCAKKCLKQSPTLMLMYVNVSYCTTVVTVVRSEDGSKPQKL